MAKEREVVGWITVKGVHVPLYEGESKGDAVKRFVKDVKTKGFGEACDDIPTSPLDNYSSTRQITNAARLQKGEKYYIEDGKTKGEYTYKGQIGYDGKVEKGRYVFTGKDTLVIHGGGRNSAMGRMLQRGGIYRIDKPPLKRDDD